MKREVGDGGPPVEQVLDLYREMSHLRSPRATVAAFMRRIGALSPADHLVFVTPWPPVAGPVAGPGPGAGAGPGAGDGARAEEAGTEAGPPGRLRVLFDGPPPDDGDGTVGEGLVTATLDPEVTGRLCDSGLVGGLVGDLVAGGRPTLIDELAIDPADPVLGTHAGVMRSGMIVPIFWEGHVAAWTISLARRPAAFGPEHLRLALGNANMLMQSVVRLRTLAETRRLNERLLAQMQALARTQRSLLPAAFPAAPELSFAVTYEPCEAAGGDYYDFMVFPDGRVGTIIADVSGHGAAAAVVMAMMRTTMSAFRLSGRPPRTVVSDVNRALMDAVGEGTFVTAFLLLLEPASGRIAYANCGHPPPRVRSVDGDVFALDADGGPPLGIFEDLPVAGGEVRLAPGDTVLMYTDGITEAFDPAGRMLTSGALDRIIAGGPGDAEGLVSAVHRAVQTHAAGRPRDDDQTLLAVRWQPAR